MSIDYSKLAGKHVTRLSADEMAMFKTDAGGKMTFPRSFACYLEEQCARTEDEEKRREIKECSLKYMQALSFTDAYLETIKR